MVRTVSADITIEKDLQKLSKLESISIGLILGQPTVGGRDHVVHLAKTPLGLPEFENHSPNNPQPVLESVVDFDNNLLCDHALSVIRMLPGGFFVLGLFVVSPKAVFNDDPSMRKLKSMLTNLSQVLKGNSHLYGDTFKYDGHEMLLFHYSSSIENSFACKAMSSDPSKGHSTKNIDWKFQDKTVTWQLIETYYEINEVFPYAQKDTESNLLETLEVLAQRVKDSVVFLDGRPTSDDQVLGSLFDMKCGDNSQHQIQSQVFFPCPFTTGEAEGKKIEKYAGLITYSGTIGSRIWAHSKQKLSDIETAIKEDIIRSLASRTQIFCDALVETEGITDNLIVNEPPRRVFLKLANGIQFCDYLFRNESEETSIAQAREQLHLELTKADVVTTVETFSSSIDDHRPHKKSPKSDVVVKDHSRLYMIGIVTALLVLILSITLHFVMN